MEVVSIANRHSNIFRIINHWVERQSDITYSTSTVFVDLTLIPKHLKKARNRSIFIRECCEKFLDLLMVRYKKPRIIACSRSEFVRLSLLMEDLGIIEPSPLRDPDYIPKKNIKRVFKTNNGSEVITHKIRKYHPLGNEFLPNKNYTNKEVLRLP